MNEHDKTEHFGKSPLAASAGRSLVFTAKGKDENKLSNTNGLFDESTRELLRFRLMVAATTTLILLLAIKALSFTLDGLSLNDLLYRLTAVSVLAGTCIYLSKHLQVSLITLRMLEIVVFAIPVAEAQLVMIQEVRKRVASGELNEIPTLFALICFAVAILIAIDGMYIPSNWKRTLVLSTLAALSPPIVAVVHQLYIDVPIENYPGFAAPLMTLAMAAIATKASHIVQSVRREVAAAKQYGQYHLDQRIGEGGMGIVYLAKHQLLKRAAAIKLIRTDIANQPDKVAEFEHEVQLSALLKHWNTVQIYDYGRTDDGEFFYVMEYLEGLTLEQRIWQGKLTPAETVHIMSQVCDGLAEAHIKGMIHRDIKPANLFLTKVGAQRDVVKILDFGLAAMKSDLSRLKKVSGTPAYISPEQIQLRTVDNRSDIYSVGLVLYECLTGHRLMIADSIGELLNLHIRNTQPLDKLPEDAAAFADIINMCIEKDPANRFQNVDALKNALQSLSRGSRTN